MALTDNLTHGWKLDETGTSNASDSIGSATLTNTTSKSYVSALINNGIDMGSSVRNTTELTTSTDVIPGATSDFSISLWFKQNTSTQTATDPGLIIVSANSASGYALSLQTIWNSGSPLVKIIRRTSSDATATSSFGNDTTTWHHLVCTYDSALTKLYGYLDGSAFSTTNVTSSGTFNSTAYPRISIGGSYMSNNATSKIDEVWFWSRVLTSAEVTSLYNGGAGLAYPFSASGPANLKSYNTNVLANIKSIDTNVIANIKSLNTNV